MIWRLSAAVACAVAAVTLGALPAAAHVTVSPATLAQGTSDAILTFRVPTESATAATTGLRIQFPRSHPIVVVSPEAGSGWQVAVVKTTLPKPITTDDGSFTSITSEIDWSGGTIPVGQFGEFNVLAQGIPSGTSELAFKAIQTYSDGTVVSWIEVPSRSVPQPAHPAPIITLTTGGAAGAAGARRRRHDDRDSCHWRGDGHGLGRHRRARGDRVDPRWGRRAAGPARRVAGPPPLRRTRGYADARRRDPVTRRRGAGFAGVVAGATPAMGKSWGRLRRAWG